MTYQLLIFDWDGTLMDSAARIVSSFQGAARELDMTPPEPAAVHNVIGLGLVEAIAELMPELDTAGVGRVRQAYARHFLELDSTPVSLFEGVADGLYHLSEQGYRLAIATGKSRRGLDRVLNELSLATLFEATRCADETRSKPHPLMLEQLLAQSGVPASAALMIGDTVYDMEMAQRAGIDALAVSYGVHAVDRLQALQPRHTVDSFAELKQWLLNGGNDVA